MDEYATVKKSKLKFKSDKKAKKKCKLQGDSTNDKVDELPSNQDERKEDAEEHEGWWKVSKFEHIRNYVCVEFLPGCYAKALNNGNIILGKIHPPGEGPDEEEIFTAICPAPDRVALKSGFDRYLSVDNRKRLMGLSLAIGEQEMFEPVFGDGKLALAAHNNCFLSPDEETDSKFIVAINEAAGLNEMLNIRVDHDPCVKR